MEPTEPNEGSAKSRKKKQSLTCKDAKQKCYASTRSGLLPFTRFIEGLSEEKRNHVKDLGLGGLLGLQIKQNRNMEVVELLKRLNWQTRILNVHGKALPMTEEVVGRIMGLPCGGRDISKLKINLGKLRHRYNVRRESRKELIEQLISMEPGEEWQANFILLANHCVMRPSSSLSCSPNSLEFMDDVRNLREMNWCKYILDGLCAGAKDLQLQLLEIDNGSRSSLNLKGCTVLLEIFYVEHVQSAVVLAPWNHRPLPRLSDWTDDSMRKVYASVGKKFDDSSVILVSSNEEQYQRGFAEIRTEGGSYPLQQIDSNLTLSMVMEKIRIHEMRLDGIEKQLKVITDLVRQIVPAGCGQQRDKMEGLVQRMGGWEHGEPSTCNGKMVEPIVDNIGEDIATPCAPKNDVVRVSPEIEILGADKVEDCYVPSPPPKIEVHPVKKNLQSDAIEAVKTENPVAPLEKTMDEVHDEMGVEMDVEEKNIGAEDKLNVHRSKRRRKPQGGREIIVTRSMKAKELDDLISIESNNSVFRISPTKPTRKRKDLGLRSTSELKKGKMQQAPYITEADMKAKKKKGTKPGALFLRDSGDSTSRSLYQLLENPLADIYEFILNGTQYEIRKEVFECDDEFASRKDLQCLKPYSHVTDTVINLSIYLLSKQQTHGRDKMHYYWHMPTYFSQTILGANSLESININNMIKTYRRNKLYTGELSNLKQICIPMFHQIEVNVGHWYLFVVDVKRRKGFLLDSMKLRDESPRVNDCEKVLRFLKKLVQHSAFDSRFLIGKPQFDAYPVEVMDVRQQSNTFDCGVYVIQYMRNISDFPDVASRSFDSTTSSERREIMHWLCTSEFNEARDNVCQGAIAYLSYCGRRRNRTEAKALQKKLGELTATMQ